MSTAAHIQPEPRAHASSKEEEKKHQPVINPYGQSFFSRSTDSDQNVDPNCLTQHFVAGGQHLASISFQQPGKQQLTPDVGSNVQPFGRVPKPRDNVTPMQPAHKLSDPTPNKRFSTASMTARSSISSQSINKWACKQTIPKAPSFMTRNSAQKVLLSEASDKASVCHTSSWQSKSTQPGLSSPSFASSTVSSRKRLEKSSTTIAKPEQWTPSTTKAKSPHLRSFGKTSVPASDDDNEKKVSSYVMHCSSSDKRPTPSVVKTPNVLRRQARCTRRTATPEQPNRMFVPNPIPRYLKTGNLPEVKQTRKSMQLREMRSKPERVSRIETPKKIVSRVSLEPTAMKPFDLESVVKHEERRDQIRERLAAEEDENRRRREFHPVALRPEILRGPTFVPTRREEPPTRPADLLPHARERSERTLAFEARQRARMEEMERNKQIAAKQRQELVHERLRKEYESKRFKSKPVPQSHYSPDISPVRLEMKADSDKVIAENISAQQSETEECDDVPIQSRSEESKSIYDHVSVSMCDTASPAPSESKAVAILQGIRNSLSPLLGRGSTSPS